MMNTRSAVVQTFNYSADFQRVSETLPIRYATYLTDWRCSFSVLSEHVAPKMVGGTSVAKWMAVAAFYTQRQVPQNGDRLHNLRLKRNGQLVEENLQVVEVVPHYHQGLYILFLNESSTR